MSEHPLRLVIDANVALKLFFEQPGSEQADALFAHLEVENLQQEVRPNRWAGAYYFPARLFVVY